MSDKITIPTNATSDGADIGAPTTALARSIQILGDPDDQSGGILTTPDSIQVIKAGALQFSKLWSVLVAGGTSVAGVASVVSGTVRSATSGFTAAGQAAFIGGGFALLAAGALAIAVIVSADVKSRAAATVAQINGRVTVARTVVEALPAVKVADKTRRDADRIDDLSIQHLFLLAAAAFPDTIKASESSNIATQRVTGIKNTNAEGPSVRLQDGDWVQISRITRFDT